MIRRRALTALFLACLLAAPVLPPGQARGGDVPEVTGMETYCPSCWGRNGSHKSNCPYAGGGGGGGNESGDEGRSHVDITHAPIFVAPVGLVGGVFMGAGWYFSEMAGKYPGVSILDSYHNFMSIKSDDKQFTGPFNAGTHTGGLPWLIVGAVTLPIRAGVVALANLASRPSPPPPPKRADPNLAVYEAIAKSYQGLRDEAEAEMRKSAGDVGAAEFRRDRYLDAFIADRPKLRDLRESKGIEAARAQAAKELDAWSRSRREKAKLAAELVRDIREKDAFCREAIEKAGIGSFLVDFKFDKVSKQLEALKDDLSLPKGIRDSFAREHRLTERLSNGKSYYAIADDIKTLTESGMRAHRDGKNVTEWVGESGTEESLLRLNLKLLTVPKRMSPFGAAAGAAETAMDFGYGVAVNTYFAAHVENERALLGQLASARVFEDAAGDAWDRVNFPIEAAREREKTIRARYDRYAKLATENEALANRYR